MKIRLKKFPFKKYNFKCGQYHFKSDAETYIDYEKLYIEDKTTIAGEPQLVKVIYTNDENMLIQIIQQVNMISYLLTNVNWHISLMLT